MAFHPYPQLIPSVFNLSGFGPPRRLTVASTWPWVDHSASGLDPATMIALFGLAFATASPHGLTSPLSTNSQAHSSKGTLSPLLGRLQRIVGTRFQVLFHSPPGVLFTIPSRYSSAIGHQKVFRQPSGLGRFTQDSTGPVLLGNTRTQPDRFHLRGSHPLRPPIPRGSATHPVDHCAPSRQTRKHTRPTTPQPQPLPGHHTETV